MNRFRAPILPACIMAALAAAVPAGPATAVEQATIEAFAAWSGEGRAVQTGPNEATFVGTLSGTVYGATENGPVESGRMLCPAIVRVNMEDGSQSGAGRCSFTAKDGAQIFAELTCTGIHLIGCDGDFTLTGGSGRFAGIGGGGKVTLRSEFRELVGVSGGSVVESVSGIMFWPSLSYQLP
jgi:hypothetical protein